MKLGFYLLKTTDGIISAEVEIIKRLGDGMFIVRLHENQGKEQLYKTGELYKVTPEWKLAPDLKEVSQPLLLSVKTLRGAEINKNSNLEVLQRQGDYLVLEASPEALQLLLQDPGVVHISRYHRPRVETSISYHDLSVNRINYLHDRHPMLKGKDMRASVKENLPDLEDLDLRNRLFSTGLESDKTDQHASVIATLIAGAGNSSSKGKGVAPEAEVGSSSFLNLFPDKEETFIDMGISVQNHSYGTTVDYEYGNEAAAYDAQVEQLPWLVHVFSSGNLGTETPEFGRYAGIPGVANLTGNFKFAKNIITVGALDVEGKVPPQSSKGPAPDGRLKPELVAYAPAGTSDAAALVSGTVLLLQEKYLKQKQELPSAALIKSVLIAGAEDAGAQNIDIATGYGNLDAAKSVEILESGSFFENEVTGSETVQMKLDIPEGTKEVRIALSWLDPAANPGDEKTLIHDLDLQLIAPDGSSWRPWVLDTRTGAEGLKTPARRGRDSLNPVELITLDSPVAGRYSLQVSATDLSEPQSFSLAYVLEAENTFTWTYPTSSDALWDDQENRLRWQNSYSSETARLEIRFGDSDWQLIQDPIDLKTEVFALNLQQASGTAQLRMTIGTREYLSEVFAIAPELFPEIAFNCDDEFRLVWEKVEGAGSYEVKYLDEQYMEIAMEVQDTSVLINKSIHPGNIWAVTPLFEDLKGRNGVAIDYSLQGVGCHYRNFFAYLEQGPQVNTNLNLSSGLFISEVRLLRQNSGDTDVIKIFPAPIDTLQLQFPDHAPKAGENLYYAEIVLNDGTEITTEDVEIFVPGPDTFEVYPNPVAAGEILSIRSMGDELDFQVFDFQGRLLSEDVLLRYNDQVELKIHSRGLYFVRALREGKEVGVAKIIIY